MVRMRKIIRMNKLMMVIMVKFCTLYMLMMHGNAFSSIPREISIISKNKQVLFTRSYSTHYMCFIRNENNRRNFECITNKNVLNIIVLRGVPLGHKI